ncbi:YitT family protein [Enterococcus sp.]|uniref:YczE/YyaS/YitT family protein n=1 Tax=Enterococcus sp. TaxID=35783 RepID=UPI0025BCAA66|nr:YitT family protein [Enterococcus sp.]
MNKIFQILLGTCLIALAISLLITAHQGYDTISTFLLGILNHVSVPFWVASLCFNLIILGIIAIIDRQELGIGSYLNGIGLGLLIGIFEPVMDKIFVHLPYYSWLAIFSAPILFGIGAGIYVSANQGSAALEALTAVIYKRTKLTQKTIRIGLDATMVLVGFGLGARIGLGTLLCILFVGPIFEATVKTLAARRK